MKVSEITQTCLACPSQWEGILEDGRMFYVRYRWGELTIIISKKPTKNLDGIFDNGKVVYSETLGDDLDGFFEKEKLVEIMEDIGFLFN